MTTCILNVHLIFNPADCFFFSRVDAILTLDKTI